MQDYYSALNTWSIPLLRAMDKHKIDTELALKTCGFSQEVSANLECRSEIEKFSKIISYCNNKLACHNFSILVAEQFHPSTFHAIGYAMMSAKTLQDALGYIGHYQRIISNTCNITNYEDGELLIFEMNIFTYEGTNRPVLSLTLVETFLATIIRLARELIGFDFAPEKVCFAYSKPNNDITYLEDFFNCNIEFNSNKTAIFFNLKQTQKKLICGNPLITHTYEKVLDEFLVRVDKNDLNHLVKCKVFDLLPLGAPSQSDIAENLGISLRTLQRKLHDQGTTYKAILEDTRKKLAMDYIMQQHLSLSEIGYLVGFSSAGNFHRAFKRWTNQTPGDYRQNN